jgi:uncharacterized membrane protein
MICGLLVNWILPLIGITTPLSLFSLLVSFDIILLSLLCIGIYRYAGRESKTSLIILKFPKFQLCDRVIILSSFILPFLAVIGALILNGGGTNNIIIFMLLSSLAIFLFTVILQKKLDDNVMPFVILMIGVSFILMGWLRSNFVSGMDINNEYLVFQTVINNGFWSPSLSSIGYNSCLSVSILPTIITVFSHIKDVYIFKIIIPTIYSFVFLAVFLFVKKFFNRTIAFIAVFFFISQPTIFNWWWIPLRQQMAFLFFALLMMVLFDNLNSGFRKMTLIIIFMFSLIVSHYTTAYLTLALLLSTLALHFLIIFSIKIFPSLKRKIKLNRIKITSILVILFFIFTIFWYGLVNNELKSVTNLISDSVSNLFKHNEGTHLEESSFMAQFNPFYRVPSKYNLVQEYVNTSIHQNNIDKNLKVYPNAEYDNYKPSITSPQKIHATISNNYSSSIDFIGTLLKIITKIFIVIGVAYLLYLIYNKKFFELDYVILCLLSLFIILMIIILPFASIVYDLSRTFQQVLVFLALPAVLGALLCFWFLKPNYKYVVVAILFGIYFLFYSGLASQILIGGTADAHLNNVGNNYDQIYVHDSEIIAATWLINYGDKKTTVMASPDAVLRLNLVMSDLKNPVKKTVLPQVISKNSYVYYVEANKLREIMTINPKSTLIPVNYPFQIISNYKNIVYDNGYSGVFR